MSVYAVLCVTVLLLATADGLSYEQSHLEGAKAYLNQEWEKTVELFRHSIGEWDLLEETRRHCYTVCSEHSPKVPSDYSQERELQFFHSVLARSRCVRQCQEDRGVLTEGAVPRKVYNAARKRQGLYYLQMALHKEGHNKEAAQAFADYYYYNPQDQNSRTNFMIYLGLEGVTEEDLQPKASMKYRDLYVEGDGQYTAEDWSEMVDTFERALPELYTALEQCRRMCEGPQLYTNTLDFYQTISKLHLEVLDCQIKCPKKLGEFRKDTKTNFVGEYFNYLQYGYYHLNQTDQAMQAAAAQMRVDPQSKASREIASFYREKLNSSLDVVRQDIIPQVLKHEVVARYRRFSDDVSGRKTRSIVGEAWGVGDENGDVDEELLEKDFQRFPVVMETYTTDTDDPQPEPVVVQTAADYDGLERMLVDNLLTQQQCEKLIKLASYGKEGDGYQQKSPHTQKETFVGLHVLDSAKRSSYGEIDPTLSWLYINASRWSKDVVSKVFNLEQPLYFSYTHLVCRTSIQGKRFGRDDLSHPVHSDNCILNDQGECNKVPPAYTWRDYSALLYLNGDFDGGEFFWAHSTKDLSPDVLVKPECGRLVGFSAGKENMHGVKAVTRGRRCAVALWFTMDPNYSEVAFDQAETMLASL